MRICVVGAGAIGGYLGAKLALAGEDVTLIARGPHLAAIQRDGLKLQMGDGPAELVPGVRAMSDMAEAGEQDAVLLTLKTHSVPGVVKQMRALYGPQTIVLTAQNGIPWWYFMRHGGEFEGRRLASVDPGGVIADNLEIERVIGCIVYPAADLPAPGVVRHVEGDRFSLGEPDGSKSERVLALSQTLARAGLKAPVRTNLRAEIWVKVWGNAFFNPISALTGTTLEEICSFPATRELARVAMTESMTVAERLGIKFGVTLEQRIDGAQKVGAHKPSMLQDIETQRPTEVDAVVGAVVELGRIVGVPTPVTDTLYRAVKLLEKRVRG